MRKKIQDVCNAALRANASLHTKDCTNDKRAVSCSHQLANVQSRSSNELTKPEFLRLHSFANPIPTANGKAIKDIQDINYTSDTALNNR